MLLLYIYHQTVSKQCFLVGESRYQSYVYFQALKCSFWQKSLFFFRKFYSQHILISLIGHLIWYQICNCSHYNFEEILNFQFSEMSYSWICPSSETELRLIFLQYCDLPPLITVEDRQSLSSEKLAWPAVSSPTSPTAEISVYQWLPLLQDFLQFTPCKESE